MMEKIDIITATASNVYDTGIFCLKNKKNSGYQDKIDWFKNEINKGLTIKIALDEQKNQLGFIEYIPAELAWRPVKAENYFFIHCIVLFAKNAKNKGVGSALIKQCTEDAKHKKKAGICVMTSKGTWIADKTLFEKNGFKQSSVLGRFELMYKSLNKKSIIPQFNDWTKQQSRYNGWHLIYADQCPLHSKSVKELKQAAIEHNIKLTIKQLKTRKMPKMDPLVLEHMH